MRIKLGDRLFQLALKIRELEGSGQTHSKSPQVLRIWILGPSKKLIGIAALFVLTYSVGVLCPGLLYRSNTESSKSDLVKTPFLDQRAFLISLLACFEVLAGETLTSQIDDIQQIEEPVLAFVARHTLTIATAFLFVAQHSWLIWIASRAARSPLTLRQSIQISGYGLSMIAITVVLCIPIGVTVFSVVPYPIAWSIAAPNIIGLAPWALAFIAAVHCVVYVVFVGPLSAFYPSTPKRRLWFGYYVGWICSNIMLLLLAIPVVVSVAAITLLTE